MPSRKIVVGSGTWATGMTLFTADSLEQSGIPIMCKPIRNAPVSSWLMTSPYVLLACKLKIIQTDSPELTPLCSEGDAALTLNCGSA